MADLRPMGVGEVLDGALTIYRRHFMTFLALGIISLWLPVALSIYVQLSGPQQHIGLALCSGLLQYFAGLLLTAGVIRVISDFYLGRASSVGEALALGLQKVWPLFLVGWGKVILLGLIVMLLGAVAAISIPVLAKGGALGGMVGVALLVAVGWFAVYVSCGYGATTQVVVLEPLRSSFDAFGRSWDLTRGRKLHVVGVPARRRRDPARHSHAGAALRVHADVLRPPGAPGSIRFGAAEPTTQRRVSPPPRPRQP
ncbi:MAG: hypothetical protein DMD46_02420 [Gemmatimonadetes bacterium]|nr:MAG: hypothetical protein DMD46_02420 [Gemmatimonadota bacterium]